MSEVFELINTLSKGEKKIVRIRAERNKKSGGSAYLTLFDIYLSLKVYDKKVLKEKAINAGIKQLPVLKMRLFTFILSSIRSSYVSHRKIHEVRELMDYSNILTEKNLFESSKKILLKAKKIVLKYEMLRELAEINDKLKTVSVLSNDLKSLHTYIESKNTESREALKRIQLIEEYDSIIYETKYYLIQNYIYGVEYDKEQTKIIRQNMNILGAFPEINHPIIEIKTNQIWSFIHLAEGNFSQSIDCRIRSIELLKANKHKIEDDPVDWLYNQTLLIITLYMDKRYEETNEEAKKFEETINGLTLDKSNKRLIQAVYSTIFMIKLNDFISRKEFIEGEKYLDHVNEVFKDGFEGLDFNNQQVIVFNMMYVYIGSGNYKEALKKVNHLLNHNYKKVRLDIQVYTRLVNIIIHFELANYRLIENLADSALRFIKSVKHITKFEKLFLNYAKNHLSFGKNADAAKEFHSKILKLENNSFQDYFDFENWTSSLIDKK